MQRRHAIIAAIALVALVLIPAAALALGPGGGLGHRGGPGPKNLSASAPTWAGNATHPSWAEGDGPGNRTFHGNASCAGNLSCDRDRAQQRSGDCPGNSTGSQDPGRAQLRDRSGDADRIGAAGTNRTLGLQRGGRGICR